MEHIIKYKDFNGEIITFCTFDYESYLDMIADLENALIEIIDIEFLEG